jgi:hypothetical protein
MFDLPPPRHISTLPAWTRDELNLKGVEKLTADDGKFGQEATLAGGGFVVNRRFHRSIALSRG